MYIHLLELQTRLSILLASLGANLRIYSLLAFTFTFESCFLKIEFLLSSLKKNFFGYGYTEKEN